MCLNCWPKLFDLHMNTVVLIPTYNEIDNLAPLIHSIRKYLPGTYILVIDDNSPDGTGVKADEIAQGTDNRVCVLHRPRKEGLGKAYVDGYVHALNTFPNAEFFIQMDADLSHDPRYLPEMLETAQSVDLVVGSPNTVSVSRAPAGLPDGHGLSDVVSFDATPEGRWSSLENGSILGARRLVWRP